ncbi:MAG: hypothetical protein JWO30_347 [Fibrobacteres bacterium]|nr:hypothetical protein [Fibrobacterota bacterium]
MRSRILPLAFTLSLAWLPARALNVTGHVIDKQGTPLWSAKVCVKSDASVCVNTDMEGAFHIQTAVGVRKTSPESAPYIMDIRNGMLSLTSPAAAKARLEWTRADGSLLFKAKDFDLARGRNAIALPKGLPDNGICFIRLNTADLSLTWKAVLMGSRGNAAARADGAASGRIVALSKTASGGTLEVTKPGYRTRLYEPLSDPDPDALIFLSTPDDVGISFAGNFKAKVIAIDRTNKTLIVESVDAFCDSDVVAHDTIRDTSQYAFKDGKFWLWSKGACSGQVFTGTGTDPVGTWTLIDNSAELPADLRAGCIPDTSSGSAPFDSTTAVYAITETTITGNVSVEFCPADLYGPIVALLFQNDPGVTLAKNTCKQVVFKNAKKEDGTLNFTKAGDSLHTTFTYKTTTCSFNQDLALSDKDPTCPEDDSFFPFFICMAGSGFSDSVSLGAMGAGAKTSALSAPLPMSLEHRLARSLPVFTPAFPAIRVRQAPAATSKRGSIFPFHGWRPESAR